MATQTSPLPNPILQTHIEMIDASIQPIVDRLSHTSPFISAGLFIEDNHHKGEAGTASIVNTPVVKPEFIDFTESSVRGRRIDLSSTVLGKVFTTHESTLEISKLDPTHHVTLGIYCELRSNRGAVLQLVFDRNRIHLIDKQTVMNHTAPFLNGIWASSKLLANEATHTSLADELLLNTPVTPNAYILKWDVLQSTRLINASGYPLFRHYLSRFELAVEQLADQYGAKITEYAGDSQNIILSLPSTIDKSDLKSVGEFGHRVALPFARHLVALHDSIAARYSTLPKIRACLALGYAEHATTSEVSGPIFWEIAKLLRNGSEESLVLNQAAQLVMKWSEH